MLFYLNYYPILYASFDEFCRHFNPCSRAMPASKTKIAVVAAATKRIGCSAIAAEAKSFKWSVLATVCTALNGALSSMGAIW